MMEFVNMTVDRRLLVYLSVVLVIAQPHSVADDPIPSDEMIRFLLKFPDPKRNLRDLIPLGARAFPAYERILNDRKVGPSEIEGVFGLFCQVDADRGRFIEAAVKHLNNPDISVRWQAVLLLGQIGSPKDCSPIVALLWDEDIVIVNAAATTLAAIGGDRELTAMYLRLRSSDLKNNVTKLTILNIRIADLKNRLRKQERAPKKVADRQ